VPERAYLSIGEVLALLKDEFTDITISKIRFLESQGLIDPERTPSGYRKFYEPDVERLRWILRQQKEHYLPLRVIKGKLSEAPVAEEGGPEPPGPAVAAGEPEVVGPPPALAAVPDPPEADVNGARHVAVQHGQAEREAVLPVRGQAAGATPAEVRGPDGSESDPGAEAMGRRAAPPFPESLRRSTRSSPAGFLTAPEPPRPASAPAPPASRAGLADDHEGADEEVELTADELAAASGLPAAAVSELERYGLVKGQRGPGGRYYDAAALEVATLAAAFAEFGVEARHLKMWKTAADREADFYEQVVTPLRSQRSNKARRQAGDTLAELAELGARLHAALVAGAMKGLR
jgi:DNA-binding transcriptional MerR regulator